MKNYTKLKRALITIATTFLIFTMPTIVSPLVYGYKVLGEDTKCDNIDSNLCPTENSSWLVSLIGNATKWLMYAVGIASIIFVIVGGLRYILAAGNDQQLAGAKKTIIGSIIGLAVAILSITITSFVMDTMGLS